MKNSQSIYSKYFTYIKPLTRIPIVKNYGSTIFTIFITMIFIIFAIKPTIETILVLQKKLSDSNQVFKKITEKAENLSTGRQNYDQMDMNIKAKIQSYIPDLPQIKSITQSLEQTAQKHSASVSALQIQPLEISPKEEDHVGSITEISFIFNTTGNYQNLISLLQDLKSNDRLIKIDSLSLSTLTEGEGIIMSISGKAYYIK